MDVMNPPQHVRPGRPGMTSHGCLVKAVSRQAETGREREGERETEKQTEKEQE